MINKKTMKIICGIVIALTIIVSIANICLAAVEVGSIDANGTIGDQQVTTIGSRIATIVRNVGIALAVIILMILGIKYMIGSAEEKSELKKTMIPYLIGALILFGASGIAQLVVSLSNGITTGS